MRRKSLGECIDGLITTSNRIWHLESDVRKGREGELGLEEVGRRAILIRELNAERVEYINGINEIADPDAKPIIKVAHASARFRQGE